MSNQRSTYISRINKAIDYIVANLQNDLNLKDIARAGCFSPYHFHRIFKSFMNESLNNFIRRVRVEKASIMLMFNPNYSITEIAHRNGYSSSQSFAKEFRTFYKTTPTEFRNSKIRHINSKNRYAYNFHIKYNNDNRPTKEYYSLLYKHMKVEIKQLPDMTLAYIRHIGPYKGNPQLFAKLFEQLCKWAGSRNLINDKTTYLCIYYDSPEETDESKSRMDICLTVPKDTKVDGEIGKQEIKGGEYAVGRCIIKDPSEYAKYWNELYMNWLPKSGFQPDDKVPFEMYPPNYKTEEGDMIVDICIPVKPM